MSVWTEFEDDVGPTYRWATSLMSSFGAYSGFGICFGILFNVKFWGVTLLILSFEKIKNLLLDSSYLFLIR